MVKHGELIRLLEELYEQRKAKNHRYSLRAFAKSLGMHSATLSRLMTGTRRVTYEQAFKLMDQLKISDPELRLRIAEETAGPRRSKASERPYAEVDLTRFAVIRDWQHSALLCALEIRPTLTPAALGKQLGLSTDVIEQSLARLERVGLLRKQDRGWKVVQPNQATAQSPVPNEHLAECNRQYLDLARLSLTECPFELREHVGITMTVNPERLPLLKKAMRDFLERAAAIVDDGSPKSVYRLNLQLFPLVKKDFE